MTCLVAAPAAFAVLDPVNSSPPTTSGTYQVAHLLHGDPGEWDSLTTPTYTYRWCRINGSSCPTLASTQNYTPVAADIGHRLRLDVTADNGGGSPSTAKSAATPVIAGDPPDNVTAPALKGSAEEGSTLMRGSLGTWRNPTPTSYATQFLRCDPAGSACTGIAGSTGPGYTPTDADVGHRLRLQVTAKHAYGNTTAVSAASAVVAALPAPAPRTKRRKVSRLRPFPKIVVAGSLSPAGAIFRQVVVRGPRNVTVRVRCRGGGCPFRKRSYRMRKRKLRLRSLERNFRAGAVIEVRVVKKGRVGKYTRIRIRRGRVPKRLDRCLNPGSSRPRKCK